MSGCFGGWVVLVVSNLKTTTLLQLGPSWTIISQRRKIKMTSKLEIWCQHTSHIIHCFSFSSVNTEALIFKILLSGAVMGIVFDDLFWLSFLERLLCWGQYADVIMGQVPNCTFSFDGLSVWAETLGFTELYYFLKEDYFDETFSRVKLFFSISWSLLRILFQF